MLNLVIIGPLTHYPLSTNPPTSPLYLLVIRGLYPDSERVETLEALEL
jgi:hypothetical protein